MSKHGERTGHLRECHGLGMFGQSWLGLDAVVQVVGEARQLHDKDTLRHCPNDVVRVRTRQVIPWTKEKKINVV